LSSKHSVKKKEKLNDMKIVVSIRESRLVVIIGRLGLVS